MGAGSVGRNAAQNSDAMDREQRQPGEAHARADPIQRRRDTAGGAAEQRYEQDARSLDERRDRRVRRPEAGGLQRVGGAERDPRPDRRPPRASPPHVPPGNERRQQNGRDREANRQVSERPDIPQDRFSDRKSRPPDHGDEEEGKIGDQARPRWRRHPWFHRASIRNARTRGDEKGG